MLGILSNYQTSINVLLEILQALRCRVIPESDDPGGMEGNTVAYCWHMVTREIAKTDT